MASQDSNVLGNSEFKDALVRALTSHKDNHSGSVADYTRTHRQTEMISAPASFVSRALWPEFQELGKGPSAHILENTNRIFRLEIFASIEEADAISELGSGPAKLLA